jgi:hypothetical protein
LIPEATHKSQNLFLITAPGVVLSSLLEDINMNGRAAGVGFPILMGAYLLYKYLPQTKLFNENADSLDGPMAAFGAFLLIFGLAFLYKNLK